MVPDMTAESTAYTFDDVILTPKYSTLRSRSEVDTSFIFWKYERDFPIISANMETITGPEMAIVLWKLGGVGALHRFWDIEKNIEAYKKVIEAGCECLVSIGVNEESRERAEKLFEAGARMFIVDIAHGHSIMMKEMVNWLREKWEDEIFIVAGNIATGLAAKELYSWGADAVKVGVGNGGLCTTRMVTGHGVPSITAINDAYYWSRNLNKMLIADGGMRSSGDIVKALAVGADCVMLGGLLAGTDETPGEVFDSHKGKTKIYKGSASYDRGPKIAKEGVATEVLYKGTVVSIINELVAGIRSGMSYSNARNLFELKKNARFKLQTPSGHIEGLPHMTFKHQ